VGTPKEKEQCLKIEIELFLFEFYIMDSSLTN